MEQTVRLRTKVAAVGCVVVVGLVLIEITGWLVGVYHLGVGYSNMTDTKQAYLARLPSLEVSREKAVKRPGEGQFYGRRQLHPYFGYTFEPDWTEAHNNMGFHSPYDYPYVAAEDEFVVAIGGASVSLQVYNSEKNHQLIEQRLLEVLALKGYRRVTVLSLGQGGFRQPQPLYVFLYYVHMVDMMIFIEGFNEAMVHHREDYPVDFPWYTVMALLGSKSYSPYVLQSLLEVKLLTDRQVELTTDNLGSWLGYSMLAHVLWHTRVTALAAQAQTLREQVAEDSGEGLRYDNLTPLGLSFQEWQDTYVSQSEDIIRMTRAVGDLFQLPVFHVIQPNQYVEGAKPLSAKEKRETVNREPIRRRVQRYYPFLRALYAQLAKQGLGVIDLSLVFKEVESTVYIDNCCHVNQLGRELIAQALLEAILDQPERLAVIPPASERRRSLVRPIKRVPLTLKEDG